MTRKDYELIASAIRKEHADAYLMGMHQDAARMTLGLLAKRLSNELKATNPRFDSERFYNACFSQLGDTRSDWK